MRSADRAAAPALDTDELFESLLERLRRELMIEGERRGHLTNAIS